MLTLILLVVLGGGAGLAAVWLIDARGLSGLLGRSEASSLRRSRRPDTTGGPAHEEADDTPGARPEPPVTSTSEALLAPAPPAVELDAPSIGTSTVVAYEPVEPLPSPPPGRRNAQRVPAAYTAVEGSYRDVARVPIWRKLVSLVSLIGILVVVAVTITALAGATFGAIAELIDGAVG